MKAAESVRVKTYYKKVGEMGAAEHDAVRSRINKKTFQEHQRVAGVEDDVPLSLRRAARTPRRPNLSVPPLT